jgi:hypothetical protein
MIAQFLSPLTGDQKAARGEAEKLQAGTVCKLGVGVFVPKLSVRGARRGMTRQSYRERMHAFLEQTP